MTSGQRRNTFSKALLGVSAYLIYKTLRDSSRSISYEGRVAIICGGSRGLGLILARQLAAEGALVALLARDEDNLQKAKAQIEEHVPGANVFYVTCDAKDKSEVEMAVSSVVDYFGRLDMIINNAGIISVMPFENAVLEDFDEAMKTHFWGPLYMIEAALPHIKKAGGGRIVNISSIGGKVGVPHLAPYCASKFALTGLSDSIRAELARDRIYVTTICPGLMRTGSIGHGKFRGQQAKEFSWFAISDSLPLLSMNAERAARKILEAARLGKAEEVISIPAKLATQLRAIAPELNADLMGLINRFLPGPTESQNELIEGHYLKSPVVPSFLTKLSEEAAQRNNEGPLS